MYTMPVSDPEERAEVHQVKDIGMSEDSIVEPAFIAAHLDDPGVRIVEVDVSPATYKAGHIPGS